MIYFQNKQECSLCGHTLNECACDDEFAFERFDFEEPSEPDLIRDLSPGVYSGEV